LQQRRRSTSVSSSPSRRRGQSARRDLIAATLAAGQSRRGTIISEGRMNSIESKLIKSISLMEDVLKDLREERR
jgi:hypothetical protein